MVYPVSAASARVPITGLQTGDLLVNLGVLDKNNDLFFMNPLNDYLYTEDIFGNIVPKLKTDEGATAEEVAPLLGTVIPDDLYVTDGTNFYISSSEKSLTTSDLFLLAKSMVGVNFNMPVNINGASYMMVTSDSEGSRYFYSNFSDTYFERQSTLFAFYTTSDGHSYLANDYLHFSGTYDNKGRALVDCGAWSNRPKWFYENYPLSLSDPRYVAFPYPRLDATPVIGRFFLFDDTKRPWDYRFPDQGESGLIDLSTNSIVGYPGLYSKFTSATILDCNGLPQSVLDGDSQQLGSSVVQVKKDDDNNGSTPPSSPNNYEIWKSIEDLVKFIDTGEITNSETTYGDFVNNNYNYVEVNVNLPSEQNVNISGGLDINGKGDVNITVHEDVSLPSAGNGDGFFNPDAADVVAALGNDNPVMGLISGVFAAIDPKLVAIFSVSISLSIVIALWKLIKG